MMAKQKPKKPKRDAVVLLVPSGIRRKVKAIAAHTGETHDEVMQRVAGPALDREYQRIAPEGK